MMTYRIQIFTISLLFFCGWFNVQATPVPPDYDTRLKIAIKKLNKQVKQNRINRLKGLSHLNNYILDLQDPIEAKDARFVDKEAIDRLNIYLKDINKGVIKLYVTLVGNVVPPIIANPNAKPFELGKTKASELNIEILNEKLKAKLKEDKLAFRNESAKFAEALYKRSMLNYSQNQGFTAMLTISANFTFHYPFQKDRLQEKLEADVWFAKSFSCGTEVEKIFGDVVDPTGEYLNVKRGIRVFLNSGKGKKEDFYFSQKPENALANYLLVSGAFMDRQKFISDYSTDQSKLPGSIQLKSWIFEHANGIAKAVRRGQAQMAIWLFKIADLVTDQLKVTSRPKQVIGLYNELFGSSTGYIPTLRDVINKMEEGQRKDYQEYMSLFQAGNLAAKDFLHLEGTNLELCRYLLGKEQGKRQPRGKIEEYTEAGGKTALRLYTYTNTPNAVKEIAEISGEGQLNIIRFVKEPEAAKNTSGKPVNLLSQNVNTKDEPVTFLTKNPNGELGFFTKGFTIEEAQLAYQVIDKGINHFLLKEIPVIAIAATTTTDEPAYQVVQWNETMPIVGRDQPVQGNIAKLLDRMNKGKGIGMSAAEVALIETCAECLTPAAMRDRKMGLSCARRMTGAWVKIQFEKYNNGGSEIADLITFPVLRGKPLLEVLKGTMQRDVNRVTGGMISLLRDTEAGKVLQIVDLVLDYSHGKLARVILNVLPTAASLQAVVAVVGTGLVVGGIAYLIKKAVEKYSDCSRYDDLAKQVVCVFRPHLGKLGKPSGTAGLAIAQNMIDLNGDDKVLELITTRKKDLVVQIKGLAGGNRTYPTNATEFLKDLRKIPQPNIEKLLDYLLKMNKNSLQILFSNWKILNDVNAINLKANVYTLTIFDILVAKGLSQNKLSDIGKTNDIKCLIILDNLLKRKTPAIPSQVLNEFDEIVTRAKAIEAFDPQILNKLNELTKDSHYKNVKDLNTGLRDAYGQMTNPDPNSRNFGYLTELDEALLALEDGEAIIFSGYNEHGNELDVASIAGQWLKECKRVTSKKIDKFTKNLNAIGKKFNNNNKLNLGKRDFYKTHGGLIGVIQIHNPAHQYYSAVREIIKNKINSIIHNPNPKDEIKPILEGLKNSKAIIVITGTSRYVFTNGISY